MITLTKSQDLALQQMKDFITKSSDRCFILKGYAGTGKTTLMRFLLDYIKKETGYAYKLLSSTGRAAKILSNSTGEAATTIHSMIYSFNGFNKDLSECDASTITSDKTGQLYLQFEASAVPHDADKAMLYIVDEASMIGDVEVKNIKQAKFGTGRLLTELLEYDSRPACKFIFVGDPCQLPPIEGTFSPALDADYLRRTHNQQVQEVELTEIMRQEDGNNLTKAAAAVRKLWKNAPEYKPHYKCWGILPFRRYGEIRFFQSDELLVNDYVANIRQNGYNECILITSTNKGCAHISQLVRKKMVFDGVLHKGDLLMVTQNQFTTGLMNGDMVEVIAFQPTVTRTFRNAKGYQTHLFFREIRVKELFTGREYTTLVLENAHELDEYLQTGLYLDFILRMKEKGITQKKGSLFRDALEQDPFLNALRCMYGYAITCHKAQGGEWSHVYISLERRNFTLNPTKATYQWIYTALTRAKKSISLKDDFYYRNSQ